MRNSSTISYVASATLASLTLAGCSAGASSTPGPAGVVPLLAPRTGAAALPHVTKMAHRTMRPDTCRGNALYFADYQNSVIDSFPAAGGSSACTVTANGVANPIGIWVQPVSGAYYNDLFVANSGNGTAVAFKTPIRSTSKPVWQFNTGGSPSDVVQDMFGNVYVAIYGTPKIAVFTPPFDGCAYPTGCSPSSAITDPCGYVYWLATDGKGDVYSNNYCSYVSLFIAPIGAGTTGTPLSGASYAQPGGMIVDRHNRLVVNDPGSDKITSYTLNVLGAEATPSFSLALYSGVIFGIGLDKSDKFLWGANASPVEGQEYRYASGGTGPLATASDPTLIFPTGAAARPASPE
jgi:hypothetical protein